MRFLALAFLFLCPVMAVSQPATLVADQVYIAGDERLIAEGNVVVTYGTQRLTAEKVIYNRSDNTLEITGPLLLTQSDGTVVRATQATLDEELELGVLDSARLVLDRQLQLAGAEYARVSGRYTRLSRAVASSCEICARDETPLWEIRARQVIRDEEDLQIYFDDAQFRILGVPVAYLPRLRIPDPANTRTAGFLAPSIRTRSELGVGIVAPYFLPLGDHADVTLSPYLSTQTTTLEFAYRQLFARGDLSFEGAISSDELEDETLRAYIFAQGRFRLPEDFNLRFNFRRVSDNSYLVDYDYFDGNRLASSLTVDRVRDDQFFRSNFTTYQSLIESESIQQRRLPSDILEFDYRQRLFEDPFFGALWARADAYSIVRESSQPSVGRDVNRLSFGADWQASGVLPMGLVAEANAEVFADIYGIREDPDFDNSITRLRQGTSATLRYPMERVGEGGARHLLEPAVQLAWSDLSGETVPDEDSLGFEFDEGNLLSLSRFPGSDRYEEGLRLNFGMSWSRYDPAGWSITGTAGRVYRFNHLEQFGEDSGLDGNTSDWLLAVRVRPIQGVTFSTRSLLSEDLDLTSAETRFSWSWDGAWIGGTHLWRTKELTNDRDDDLSEVTLDTRFRLNRYFRASTEWRYNAEEGQTTEAGAGVIFENECLLVDLSLSRRFTTSSNVDPSTEFTLRVELAGLGTGGERRPPRRQCRG